MGEQADLEQGDTALTTELNLTLALENYGRDVDFETVWGDRQHCWLVLRICVAWNCSA
jgi:hypothetical protein